MKNSPPELAAPSGGELPNPQPREPRTSMAAAVHLPRSTRRHLPRDPCLGLRRRRLGHHFQRVQQRLHVSSGGNAHYKLSTANANPGFWTLCNQIEMAEDVYDRTGSTGTRDIVTALCNGFVANNGTSWSWNTFNDDIQWGCIAFIRAYFITGNTAFPRPREAKLGPHVRPGLQHLARRRHFSGTPATAAKTPAATARPSSAPASSTRPPATPHISRRPRTSTPGSRAR